MMPGLMVGRSGLVDELGRAWSALLAGDQPGLRTVVITGEAGMGKSMLVATALAALSPRPRAVLSGAARVHSPAPYDWLAAMLTGRDPSDLPVPGPALAWLAQHPEVPRERYAPGTLLRLAVRTVRGLVSAAAAGDTTPGDTTPGDTAPGDTTPGDTPSGGAAADRAAPVGEPHRAVVLVAEDLHALDPASLNLLGELAAVADLGALLLVTSRPPEDAISPALVARTLARLSGTAGATRQHLGPLRPAEVDAILARAYPRVAVPPGVAKAVCTRTGGNPYWVSELLATAGADDPSMLATAPLPGHLRLVRSGRRPLGGSPSAHEPSAHHPSAHQPTAHHSRGHHPSVHVGVPPAQAAPVEAPTSVDPVIEVGAALPPRAAARTTAGAAARTTAGAAARTTAEAAARTTAGAAAGELTTREVDVLHCLATGMSNKQIARSLGISVRTVTVHVSNLLRKTGSASRTEAALWAVRHDLTAAQG